MEKVTGITLNITLILNLDIAEGHGTGQNMFTITRLFSTYFSITGAKNQQLLDEVEQNIMICQWQADIICQSRKAEANN